MNAPDPVLSHPNVHHPWSPWSEDQTLHVATMYFNPFRYRNRRHIFNNFVYHMRHAANVKLHLVEVAFGDRPFEVSEPSDIRLRTDDIFWIKENALNIGVSHFPDDWKYGAYVDGDFHFTRHDWALEGIHLLQHHPWVQLFSGYGFMSEEHKPLTTSPSFAYGYLNKLYNQPDWLKHYGKWFGAPGGAWGFTKEGFDAVGGLLDCCILGAADSYMAFGMVGQSTDLQPEMIHAGQAYVQTVHRWQTRAYDVIKGNIGYEPGFCTHEWHGDISKRGYNTRWQILRDFDFDPARDLVRNSQGLLRWAGNKPKLEQAVSWYFRSRSEDSQECKAKPMY